MKKIIALAGSNSSNSINKILLKAAATRIRRCEVRMIDLHHLDLPIYSEAIEVSTGIPQSIIVLHQELTSADGFMIACPEHNGLMPAFFKNILDWLSRINQKIFGYKPVLLMSTSPGAGGGASNIRLLTELLPFWGGLVTGHFCLPSFHERFNRITCKLLLPSDEERFLYAVQDFERKLVHASVLCT